MGSSSSRNEDGTIRKNIKKIKRISPDEDSVRPEKEDRNTKKLREIDENDDYDTNQPEYHEYMFFPMKNGEEKKNDNLELLKKSIKKKKQLYTFNKEEDTRKNNDLAQILHIESDLKKPKYAYSIKQMKCDPPPVNSDYLVIEYNLNSVPNNEEEVESEEIEDEDKDSDEEESNNKSKKNKRKYKITSRVVHTNSKNCKISNYVYTQHNGERYDYLDMNKDPNQVRKLKLNKNGEEDEEKRYNEKEENQDRFINKQKKKRFTCKKMF